MRIHSLPMFLRMRALDDLVVEFEDGDKYPAAAVDFQGENDEGEFEIYVSFKDCRGNSATRSKALEAGSPEDCPGVWWTSDQPREPVGRQYTLDQVSSIHDNDKGYCVYERKPSV